MKHFLKLMDLSKEEILELLNIADQLKYEQKNQIEHKILAGKTLGMLFSKASTRTRVSFEVGMFQLGGHALFLTDSDTQIGRGETVADTARVMSRFVDGVMIRTFKQSDVEDFAKYGTVPVINGLTDYCHPCQILADLMTIREIKKSFNGLKLCFIGDGNNMANSLIVGCIKVGMEVIICCPDEYKPDKTIMEWGYNQGLLKVTANFIEEVKNCDILYTDVWASMGQEGEKEQKIKSFANFQINTELEKLAKKDVTVLHCLPAHKGEEISAEIFEKHSAEIFEQAENRLHAQKAILVKLLGNYKKK